jgi:hypothetical protein
VPAARDDAGAIGSNGARSFLLRGERAAVSGALKILVGVLTVVSVTIGIIIGVRQLIPDPEQPQHSVLILVDTSRSMKEPFGRGKTKFQAVRAQILDYARKRPDSAIALRFTGGICSTVYDPPAVTFDRDNTSEIKAAFRDIQVAGRSDFASAIDEAVNDFDRYEAGRSARVQSIWAFLGSGNDGCSTNASRKIRAALESFDRPVTFDFFAVGASQAEEDRLRRLVASLKKGGYEAYVTTPKNIPDLRDEVENTSQRETPSE